MFFCYIMIKIGFATMQIAKRENIGNSEKGDVKMKLKNLLVGLEGLKAKGDLDKEIIGIESNSKNIKEGFMFVAIKGFSVDGHEFIKEAIENGATVVAIEEGFDLKSIKFPEDVTVILAKNTRELLAISASNFEFHNWLEENRIRFLNSLASR